MKLPKSVMIHFFNKPGWLRNGVQKRLKELNENVLTPITANAYIMRLIVADIERSK